MVFAKARSTRVVGFIRDLAQRFSGQGGTSVIVWRTTNIAGGGGYVDQVGAGLNPSTDRNSWARGYHRNACTGFVHDLFGPKPLVSHHVAMIRNI